MHRCRARRCREAFQQRCMNCFRLRGWRLLPPVSGACTVVGFGGAERPSGNVGCEIGDRSPGSGACIAAGLEGAERPSGRGACTAAGCEVGGCSPSSGACTVVGFGGAERPSGRGACTVVGYEVGDRPPRQRCVHRCRARRCREAFRQRCMHHCRVRSWGPPPPAAVRAPLLGSKVPRGLQAEMHEPFPGTGLETAPPRPRRMHRCRAWRCREALQQRCMHRCRVRS